MTTQDTPVTLTARQRQGGAVAHGQLEPRERLFVSFYLQSLNGADAARRAGYLGNCYAHAHRLMANPLVKKEIDKGYSQLAPSPQEIIARISAQARANIADIIDVDATGGFKVNLAKAIEGGKIGTVRKLSYDSNGLPVVEMCDSQAALMHLAKILGLLVDKHIFAGPDGGPVQIQEVRSAMDMLMANPATMADAMALAEKLTQGEVKKLPQSITVDATSKPA